MKTISLFVPLFWLKAKGQSSEKHLSSVILYPMQMFYCLTSQILLLVKARELLIRLATLWISDVPDGN
jgi:hypothetical protein